jgi:hypothetical protein
VGRTAKGVEAVSGMTAVYSPMATGELAYPGAVAMTAREWAPGTSNPIVPGPS